MRFLHIADLHIGRRINNISMIEDQEFILTQIINIVETEKVDAVLIAGDVYDKSQPSAEAVDVLDNFFTSLVELAHKPIVIVVSGNHDCPERLSFGSRILQRHNLFIAGKFSGQLEKKVLYDEFGAINVYMLPFIRPSIVRGYFEEKIVSYDDAIQTIMAHTDIDESKRNILVAHQFVIGHKSPERTESEMPTVGDVDAVRVGAFEVFDYVALGHLHKSQKVKRDSIRYSGSPLKYSASEAYHTKSVMLIDLAQKNQEIKIQELVLQPKRDLRKIIGPLHMLVTKGREDIKGKNDFIFATYTDEDEYYNAREQLRAVFPNLMSVEKQLLDADESTADISVTDLKKDKLELFADFYKQQHGIDMNEEEIDIMKKIFMKIGEEDETT